MHVHARRYGARGVYDHRVDATIGQRNVRRRLALAVHRIEMLLASIVTATSFLSQDGQPNVLNPYESPQSASDATPAEQSDAFQRSALLVLCFSVAALLCLVGLLLCCYSALEANTAESEGQAAIGIWAILNAPAAVAMGVGIYRKRQMYSGLYDR